MEKTLESYDDVFADIVNGLLFGGRPVVAESALTDAQPVSFFKADGQLREQERDVSKYWMNTPIRIALIGFENQTKIDRFMPLRVIGYDGAAYRAQLAEAHKYPVVTLVLYFGNARWQYRHLTDCFDVPEALSPYVSDYRINVFEIAHLTEEEIGCFHGDFRVVADYFAHARTNPDYRPGDPQAFVHVDALLKLMNVISGDDRFAEVAQMEGGAPKNMCEVLDRVEQKGRRQGLRQGLQQGLQQGLRQGELQGEMRRSKEIAMGMREKLRITDPGLIAELVKVDRAQVEKWFREQPM